MAVTQTLHVHYLFLLCSSIDATSSDTPRLGRLVNHSRKNPNAVMKVVPSGQDPRIILYACRDISSNEEIVYDYGDQRLTTLKEHPWLKD